MAEGGAPLVGQWERPVGGAPLVGQWERPVGPLVGKSSIVKVVNIFLHAFFLHAFFVTVGARGQ